VIGATTLDELLQADPHNVVRLILPRSAPHDCRRGAVDPNEEAAQRLRSWLDASILAADPEPSLYVYEQISPEGAEPGWQQRGLIALVKIGTPEATGIVPHEDVTSGPVRDRRDLMAATRANLEPIFLVYQGGACPRAAVTGAGGASGIARAGTGSVATALTDEVAARRPPLVTAVTPDGIRHRLWRLGDPGEHAAVAADLATRSALIADGHHRYAAYRELQEMMPGSGPWDYGLAFLVDADVYPPRLGAIHRVIPGLPADHAARLAAKASFTVTRLDAGDLDQALDCLTQARRGGPAFLLAGPPGTGSQEDPAGTAPCYWLLTDPDPTVVDAAMPAGASAAWRRLDAAILQRVLLGHGWGIEDSERSVLVFHDAREATTAAVAAEGVAVVMGAVPFGIVRDIALLGERVPRKSTSFGPKPRSGLVLRGFDT
jgi:uncharacterized protein (DUF1015 family)